MYQNIFVTSDTKMAIFAHCAVVEAVSISKLVIGQLILKLCYDWLKID